jgi:hypothetical protein
MDLKEIFVTLTARSIFESMGDLLKKRRPRFLAHWRPEKQHIEFRSLEFQLTEQEARTFIAQRIAKRLPSNWKYILEA